MKRMTDEELEEYLKNETHEQRLNRRIGVDQFNISIEDQAAIRWVLDEINRLRFQIEALRSCQQGGTPTAMETENLGLRAQVERLEKQLAAAREDSARLGFVISAMNCWDMFGNFCEEYNPIYRTSARRATDSEWRDAIDAARGK